MGLQQREAWRDRVFLSNLMLKTAQKQWALWWLCKVSPKGMALGWAVPTELHRAISWAWAVTTIEMLLPLHSWSTAWSFAAQRSMTAAWQPWGLLASYALKAASLKAGRQLLHLPFPPISKGCNAARVEHYCGAQPNVTAAWEDKPLSITSFCTLVMPILSCLLLLAEWQSIAHASLLLSRQDGPARDGLIWYFSGVRNRLYNSDLKPKPSNPRDRGWVEMAP